MPTPTATSPSLPRQDHEPAGRAVVADQRQHRVGRRTSSGIGGGVLASSAGVSRSVATQSGATQFTRTPSTAASEVVKRIRPALAAPYSGDW